MKTKTQYTKALWIQKQFMKERVFIMINNPPETNQQMNEQNLIFNAAS